MGRRILMAEFIKEVGAVIVGFGICKLIVAFIMKIKSNKS
jgi:hypothetical protein